MCGTACLIALELYTSLQKTANTCLSIIWQQLYFKYPRYLNLSQIRDCHYCQKVNYTVHLYFALAVDVVGLFAFLV